MGVHPTRCQEIEDSPEGPEAYWEALRVVLQDSAATGKVVAIGECGLDYDRCASHPKNAADSVWKISYEVLISFGASDFGMFC